MYAHRFETSSVARPHPLDWVAILMGVLFGLVVIQVLAFMASERSFLSDDTWPEEKAPCNDHGRLKALPRGFSAAIKSKRAGRRTSLRAGCYRSANRLRVGILRDARVRDESALDLAGIANPALPITNGSPRPVPTCPFMAWEREG